MKKKNNQEESNNLVRHKSTQDKPETCPHAEQYVERFCNKRQETALILSVT